MPASATAHLPRHLTDSVANCNAGGKSGLEPFPYNVGTCEKKKKPRTLSERAQTQQDFYRHWGES